MAKVAELAEQSAGFSTNPPQITSNMQNKRFALRRRLKTSSSVSVVWFRVDVVICLSTTVRNDTLQDAKEQRVSVKCRKQLRVEEVEMVRSLARRSDRGGKREAALGALRPAESEIYKSHVVWLQAFDPVQNNDFPNVGILNVGVMFL